MNGTLVKVADIAELITKGTTPTTLGYEFQDKGVNFLKIECFDEKGNYINLIDYTYNGTTVTQFDILHPYEGARNLLTDDIEEEVATKHVDVTSLTGYDSTQTQTLKNINGVLTWVTD